MKIIPYIKFLFTSTNAHGVHSPFVFDLVQKCFYAKNLNLDDGFYSCLEENNIPYQKATLLYKTIHYFTPDGIILFYKKSCDSLYSHNNSLSDILEKVSIDLNIPYDINHNLRQDENRSLLLLSYKQKAAVLNKFEQLLPTINNNTILILNHIHASPQMEEAWTIIKHYPGVTVTIDTFTWGFVFFRNEQQKEHFIIRISKSKLIDFILGIPKLWGMLN